MKLCGGLSCNYNAVAQTPRWTQFYTTLKVIRRIFRLAKLGCPVEDSYVWEMSIIIAQSKKFTFSLRKEGLRNVFLENNCTALYCNTLFPWRTSNCAICLLSLIEWGLPRGVQGITSIVSLRNLLFIFGSLYGPYYGSYFTTKKYSAAVYYHKYVPV